MKWELGSVGPACGLIVAFVSAASFAADAEGLDVCQSIEDDAARLACFDDALASKQAPVVEEVQPEPVPPVETARQPVETAPSSDPAPAVAPEPAPEPSARTGTLNDEIGLETVKDKKAEKLSVRGRVVRCQVGRSGKYVFHFDNGQVWRQRGSARVRWKDCVFDATISEDVFGYVMFRDGDKRKVRIERVR